MPPNPGNPRTRAGTRPAGCAGCARPAGGWPTRTRRRPAPRAVRSSGRIERSGGDLPLTRRGEVAEGLPQGHAAPVGRDVQLGAPVEGETRQLQGCLRADVLLEDL